jgi:putative Mg2+ transporter-C (MgtC) family protein
MPVSLSLGEIALRLLFTVIAGVVIGLNRDEHGRAAGMRTTLLVALAASLAMLQANLLIATTGKSSYSFVTMDVMRLPLGILSGIGFIGAGAIVRRGELVRGVTTAATLWLVTVLGLCFGGGQFALGVAGLLLSSVVLMGLKQVERRLKKTFEATLTVVTKSADLNEGKLRADLLQAGYRVTASAVSYYLPRETYALRFSLRWMTYPNADQIPPFVHELAHRAGVQKVHWKLI